MRYYSSQVRQIAVLIACCCATGLSARAVAQEDTSLLINQPAPAAEEQLVPPKQRQGNEESIPAPAISEGVVQHAPPINYHASRSARRMLRCEETIELLMVTRNPADGCLYEIPLCLPACCVGEPSVEERCGLGGRGVVEYCWECGFSATVKFRHRAGDVKVDYDA
jgi:hypothetical protein